MANRLKQTVENILILQGGGSLGAFACGVMKSFAKKNIKFDMIAGTSIGAVNGAIIAGGKGNNPIEELEKFWLELAESSIQLIPDFYNLEFDRSKNMMITVKSPSASLNSAIFGVPKFFVPRWFSSNGVDISEPIQNWTYIYDNSPLAKTLEKYIDFTKLSPRSINADLDNDPRTIRLIVTAANVLTAEPIIFDSAKIQIEIRHLLASIGYPQYGFPWVEAHKTTYGWDGALLSNSPIKEVLEASPRADKYIFMVENYPRKIERLPANMNEVQSRAKDIIFCDKTSSLIKLSKLISKQVDLIEKLYAALHNCELSHLSKEQMAEVEKSYDLLVRKYGAKILSVTRIIRKSPKHAYSQQNADFSPDTIRAIIEEGEINGNEELKTFSFKNQDNEK
jgi:NTE family protein